MRNKRACNVSARHSYPSGDRDMGTGSLFHCLLFRFPQCAAKAIQIRLRGHWVDSYLSDVNILSKVKGRLVVSPLDTGYFLGSNTLDQLRVPCTAHSPRPYILLLSKVNQLAYRCYSEPVISHQN